MSIKAKNIHNIEIIGHSGEGKTTLCEAILFNGRSIDRMGKVDAGTTVSDFDSEEIARKMSVSLSVSYTVWKETKSLRWTATAFLLPTLCGMALCALTAFVTRWIPL